MRRSTSGDAGRSAGSRASQDSSGVAVKSICAPEIVSAPWPLLAGSPEPLPLVESGQVVAAVTPTMLAAPMPAKVVPMTARRLTIPWPGSGGTGVGVSGMDPDLLGFGGGRSAGGAEPPVAALMRSLWLRPRQDRKSTRLNSSH